MHEIEGSWSWGFIRVGCLGLLAEAIWRYDMSDIYEELIERSQDWQDALERALANSSDAEISVPYRLVAFAFPSAKPNEHFFDVPSIDQDWFIPWAKDRGWKVRLANEKTTEETRKLPPVHFIKE